MWSATFPVTVAAPLGVHPPADTDLYLDGVAFTERVDGFWAVVVAVIESVGFTLDRAAGNGFLQVVDGRYENNSSTIVTTNGDYRPRGSSSTTRW